MTSTHLPEAELWAAPVATQPLSARLDVPGSKSETNRMLVLAALADSPTLVRHPLRARDGLLMADALRALGARIEDDGAHWSVHPAAVAAGGVVDCGLAGTVMRFVPPVAARAAGTVRFDGDQQAYARPMGPLLGALRELGVRVDDDGRGALPFSLTGTGGVRGGELTIDASGSSQYVSALLLAGCRFEEGLTVRHAGASVPSLPHIEMTLAALRDRGVQAEQLSGLAWRVHPGTPKGGELVIEPDLSNAAPFLAAALVAGGSVTVAGWPQLTSQPGDLLREILQRMGGTVSLHDDGLTVTGTGEVRGVDLDLSAAGELTPVLAALAALADSPTTIRGVAHIRGHETDRLAALARELTALGAEVTETADGLHIVPRPLHGAVFHTYADHRMAHAGALMGLRVQGVQVEDVATTSKTLPDFLGMWDQLRSLDRPAGHA